jgi:monoamine oxidase
MTAATDSRDLDVAIVGAGVSGVYAGWRLLSAGKVKSVTIFEMSDRVGGRLLSLQPPGIPDVWCELGGMRFLSSQPLIAGLIEHLHLATHTFPVEEKENLYYLRGTQVREKDFAASASCVPYALTWAERGMSPDNLLAFAVDQMIPGVTKPEMAGKLRAFLESYKLEGRPLYDWGFWNLIARSLSHEGYELARDSGGYDTPLLNWNALDTISLNFDLAVGTKYLAVTGGYQSVPLTLAEQFKQLGGNIAPGKHLHSFDKDGEGIVLRIADWDSKRKCEVEGSGSEVRAGALVLAMPRRSLELIEPTGPVLGDATVREMIESVTPIPLFKLCVAYPYPWWENVNVTQGRTITDLPIRQCYYWGTGKPEGGDPDLRKSVLLATYDDGFNVDFWNGYSDRDPKIHPRFVQLADADTRAHAGSDRWTHYQASAAMVAEADRQLREIHNVRVSPAPYAAAYIDWGGDPYGGGVNFWNIHARSSEVVPAMVKPVRDVEAYVCGEAYSHGQGWVEGALQTAELMLQKHFDLKPPDWATS